MPAAALRGRLLDLGQVARVRHETSPTLRAPVARALELLHRGRAVADVARDVGYSRRRLATLVQAEIGVAPKTWARLARLERGHDAAADQGQDGRHD